MCKLNQDYFVSGGGSISKAKKEDYNIYIWKPDGNKFIPFFNYLIFKYGKKLEELKMHMILMLIQLFY